MPVIPSILRTCIYIVVVVTKVTRQSNSWPFAVLLITGGHSSLLMCLKRQLWCLVSQDNELQMIVRAHECVMDGFERFAQGHLITLFSATNYCGTANNAGAILVRPLPRRRGCRARPGARGGLP